MNKKTLLLVVINTFLLIGCTPKEIIDTDDIPMKFEKNTDYIYDNEVTNEKSTVAYELFVRSFYDTNNDGIGDLNGVKEKLPYLQDLGIKTLWLMPIHPSPTYHGYDVTDYFAINPDYGTMSDFENLVKEANKHNIDIMMDMVFNHCSIKHQYFIDAYSDYINDNNDSWSKKDWFNWSKTSGDAFYQNVYYEAEFDKGMPDFNLDCPAVREEIKKICEFWINKGVKGFRLDAVLHYYRSSTNPNIEFLNWLKDTINSIDPNIYLVGETWSSDTALNQYFTSKCDSFFRFGNATGGDSSLINLVKGYGRSSTIAETIEKNERSIKNKNPNAYSSYFLSNHDQDRISKNFTVEQNKIAANLYLLLPGMPFIYYGEEISLLGRREMSPDDFSDVRRRLPMIWSKDDKNGECIFPEKNRQDLNNNEQVKEGVYDQENISFSLLKHYKKVINIRNKYPFLKDGSFTSLVSKLETNDKSVMAYKIEKGNEYIIVVHNFATTNIQVKSPGIEIIDEINTTHRIPTLEDGMLTLGARSTVIMH